MSWFLFFSQQHYLLSTMMDEKTKQILLEIQLGHVVKALNAELTRTTVVDHKGNVSKRIILEYKEETNDE